MNAKTLWKSNVNPNSKSMYNNPDLEIVLVSCVFLSNSSELLKSFSVTLFFSGRDCVGFEIILVYHVYC